MDLNGPLLPPNDRFTLFIAHERDRRLLLLKLLVSRLTFGNQVPVLLVLGCFPFLEAPLVVKKLIQQLQVIILVIGS